MLSRREFLGTSAAGVALAACGPTMTAPLARGVAPRTVQTVLAGIPTTDGAGVSLTRVIGQPRLRNLDPFIMLDRFHSDDAGAYIAGFPDHPHRGFETITIMLDGRMRHRDSRGNSGLIQGGGVQWMTAGRGIIHSEMPEQEAGLMSGFQLWLNLPAREKMRAQEYHDVQKPSIPTLALPGTGHAQVIAGRVHDKSGVAPDRVTEPLLFTAMLEDEKPLRLEVKKGHTAFVFVHDGEALVAGTKVGAGNLALLSDGDSLELRANGTRTGVLVAAAKPLNEPIVQYGPFVMNTEAEIKQAFHDYRAGTLAL